MSSGESGLRHPPSFPLSVPFSLRLSVRPVFHPEPSSSSSEGSDTDWSEKRELIIPSPVDLSDAEDDGVSPSQHIWQWRNKWPAVPNSTSGSNEEEEEVVEEEVQQSVEFEHSPSSTIFMADAMMSKFTEMNSQFS